MPCLVTPLIFIIVYRTKKEKTILYHKIFLHSSAGEGVPTSDGALIKTENPGHTKVGPGFWQD